MGILIGSDPLNLYPGNNNEDINVIKSEKKQKKLNPRVTFIGNPHLKIEIFLL